MSAKIDDWRYRSEVDKIITHLYSCDLVFGQAKASDDLEAIDWFPVKELPHMLKNDRLSAEHLPLFEHVIGHYS